jgi:ABC-type amino acid transport substrate-binding protein
MRAGVWPLAGAAVAMLAAACGATGVPASAAPGPGLIHRISTMRLANDDRARERGVLAYSQLSTVPVGQAIWFDVEVADAVGARDWLPQP